MPKQKTHSATKKRFKLTGTGKLLRRPAMSTHLLGKKSPKRKRRLRRDFEIVGSDRREVKKLLGR